MRTARLLALVFLLTGSAFAQFTLVTGTVTDPNGVPYALGTIAPTLITSATPKFTSTGTLYLPPSQASGLDRSGHFFMQLADNTALTPGGTQWNFQVCSAVGTVQPAFGTGPQCFRLASPITISGSTQDITANLNAAALALTLPFSGASGNLPSAQTGDTIRWNVNGNSAWNAVNMAQPLSWVYTVWGGIGNSAIGGPMSTGYATLGSHNSINPTYNVGAGDQWSAVATPSTNTVIGEISGQNGNNSIEGITAFYRWSMKFQLGSTASIRYWLGLGSWNSTGTGSNATAILGTTRYAADAPNATTIGFRFSAGTDTHWQAVTSVAGASVPSQTFVDTGISPDTNIHLFEMITSAASTTIYYYIDSVLVATISTNIPNPANTADSWGDWFWTGDNKNSSTAISATRYYWMISHK